MGGMCCSLLDLVLWVGKKLAPFTPILGHNPCDQLTKHPNHCLSNITIALDTFNAWFWTVVKGNDGWDVLQFVGFGSLGSGKVDRLYLPQF